MRHTIIGLAFAFLVGLIQSCTVTPYQGNSSLAADIFKRALEIQEDREMTGILHLAAVYYELEGVLPQGGPYQPLTITREWWFDSSNPKRYRLTATEKQAGLLDAQIGDGAQWRWEFHASDNSGKFVQFASLNDVPPLGGPTRWTENLQGSIKGKKLWELALESKDRLRLAGNENHPKWGQVNIIEQEWDGQGAATDLYVGRAHLLSYYIMPDSFRLVGWKDQIVTSGGLVLHRSYDLIASETVDSSNTLSTLFAPVPGYQVLEATNLVDPARPGLVSSDKLSEPQLATTLSAFGKVAIVPVYLPPGFTLSYIQRLNSGGILVYRNTKGERIEIREEKYGPLIPPTPDLVQLAGIRIGYVKRGTVVFTHVALDNLENAPSLFISGNISQEELVKLVESLRPAEK